MKKTLFLLILAFAMKNTQAQDQLSYQNPSKEILELVDVKPAPSVFMDKDRKYMLLFFRDQYKSIEELSEEEMRLAGLRIDPKKNISSRASYRNAVQIRNLKEKNSALKYISGLPSNPRLANMSWSPDQSMMAMTNTTSEGVELWVIDLASASAKKLSSAHINANLGDVINWFGDGSAILVKMIAKDRKPLIDSQSAVPTGPTISVSDGKKAQNRTYQDLLKNKNDEANFEQLATSELHKISLDGKATQWLPEAKMYNNISFSPDGKYVLINTVEKPFSYLVPYSRFAAETKVYNHKGQQVAVIEKVPLIEDLPKGFMATREGKRSISWRNDKQSSLIYAEALDGGDPEVELDYRDEIFQIDAPFDAGAKSILKTKNRYSYIQWTEQGLAIAYDYWWNNRNTKTYLFDPSNPSKANIIMDRNYQDQYSDPGSFVSERNPQGVSLISTMNNSAYLIGEGFSEDGQKPFIDEINLKSLEKKRIYVSEMDEKLERIISYNPSNQEALVRIESKNEYPNYFFRNIENGQLTQITFFENPFKSIQNVHKEVITYKREDGLELSGTLYLPSNYDMSKKEKLPMILWAYPREFKDKSSASQNTQNPNEFTYPFWGSPLYWLSKGYVILDDAAFPIVGEEDEQPNDSFRSQLVSNAKAAIDAVDALGYIDRTKVAVGGHSYGAFMVANLLSHSDLFAAGIARSGAYNRTLTPFGFQSEERNYWEAPEVYYEMSPFMHADKMKTPLLLIHGEADNNSGTYPLQSERYFNALKGLGAPVRLVMLPKESHGYVAKESILHMLWEQDQWLEKYVKRPMEE